MATKIVMWLISEQMVADQPLLFQTFPPYSHSFILGYSCTIVDYLRKILFNHLKIIYVSETVSVIDKHGTLFTV